MTSSSTHRSLLWMWVPLLVGWVPIGALFATMILTAHSDVTASGALLVALRMVLTGALLGIAVQWWVARHPWPHPFRPGFLFRHLLAASAYSLIWVILNISLEAMLSGKNPVLIIHSAAGPIRYSHFASSYPGGPFLVLGVWLYVMVAGVAYAAQESARAALAEAAAARSRLTALRAQLNPHFLFNTLHSVVQLIPRYPQRAAQVAERMAGLLRHSLEEDRDLVPLESEWRFVERYLELEGMRFGERLRWSLSELPQSAGLMVPTFSLQTLVENAVRHGAAPRVEPTTVRIDASATLRDLVITVSDDGAGLGSRHDTSGSGTGLDRLRERLAALYGNRASIDLEAPAAGGVRAILRLPSEVVDE
jgi:hypothetical protein